MGKEKYSGSSEIEFPDLFFRQINEVIVTWLSYNYSRGNKNAYIAMEIMTLRCKESYRSGIIRASYETVSKNLIGIYNTILIE